jgi:hypothetical protein
MQTLHGIVSLTWFTIAVLAALACLLSISTPAGLIYLILVGLASLAVLYAYCAKCSVREHCCSHAFPGKAASWLPPRAQGPYSLADICGTGGALASIVIFPQYWLWQNRAVLVLFWGLIIIAVAEIRWWVCPGCRNQNCVMGRNSALRNSGIKELRD